MLLKFENWLLDQKDNLILWLPVFLGLGSAIYFGLEFEPRTLAVFFLWFASALLFWAAFRLRTHPDMKLIAYFAVLALFLSLTGFALAKLRTDIVFTPVLVRDTRPVMVEGNVSHLETLEGRKGTLLILEDVKIENFVPAATPKKLRLTSRLRVKFNLGDRVQMLAKLTPPSMPVSPDSYDFRRHYFFDSIGGMGFILKPPVVLRAAPQSGMGLWLERLRRDMGDHIKNVLPSRLAGIVTALVTGERAAIEDDDWNDLRVSGLAHIISISGLHVVLIATPIFFFFRLCMAAIPSFALRFPIKKIAAVIALMGCSFYVLLVVPTVPTYRALLMTGIGLIAIMLDRSPFSLRLISFAAIVVLVISPESIWSASFQLSFAAVLSLIMSAEWTREYWSRWRNNASHTRKFLIYLGGSIFTTLVVSFITAPLSCFHFQQIPVYSVIANALVIPLSGLIIMPMVIATFVLWPFGLEDWALKFMGYGVEWMLAIARGTSEIPGAALHLSAWPLSSLIFFVFAGLSLYLLAGRMRWIAAPCVIVGIILICLNPAPVYLASESGNLFMVRDGKSLYLSSAKSDRFAGESWVKRLGHAEGTAILFPQEGQLPLSDGNITCGNNMCRITKGAQKFSIGRDYYALRQDCEWADIIITPTAFRDKSCKAKIYNKFTLKDSGAIEISADGTVLTVAEAAGKRPWSPSPSRFSRNRK